MQLAELLVTLQNASQAHHAIIVRNPEAGSQVVMGSAVGQPTATFHNVGKGDHLRTLPYSDTATGPWAFDIACTCDLDRTFTQVDQTGAIIGSPQTVAGGTGGTVSFGTVNVGDQINVS